MSSIAVVGSANLDIVYRVERIPAPGETLLASSSARHPGGKGANQAIAAARSGASVTFVGAVGTDDAGTTLISVLEDSGIEASVRRVEGPSGTALIVVSDDAENTIVVDSAANNTLSELSDDEREVVARAEYLLLQLETPLSAVVDAAFAASASATVVVLNASPVQALPPELVEATDILVVNEHEGAVIVGHDVDHAADMVELLSEIVPAVVLTLGAEGSLIALRGDTETAVRRIPAIRVEAVDTTGAGDTFTGALVAALARDGGTQLTIERLDAAARYATAASALAVQTEGAVPSIPMLASVERFLERSSGGADDR